MLERQLVAEEERLVGHHGLDHLDDQRLGVRVLERLHQLGETREAGPARDGKQPAFDQILLVGGKHEPRPLLQQPPQEIIIEWSHE